MAITINIPAEQEQALREIWGDAIDRAAREALLIESYRTGRISLGFLAQLLGLSTSIQAQNWLAQHGVHLNYSHDDLQSDRATLSRLFPDFKQ